MASSAQKWNISLFSVLIFLLVVNPYTYRLTHKLLSPLVGALAVSGCPTTLGLVVHSLVFLLVIRYAMDLSLPF